MRPSLKQATPRGRPSRSLQGRRAVEGGQGLPVSLARVTRCADDTCLRMTSDIRPDHGDERIAASRRRESWKIPERHVRANSSYGRQYRAEATTQLADISGQTTRQGSPFYSGPTMVSTSGRSSCKRGESVRSAGEHLRAALFRSSASRWESRRCSKRPTW